jgi:Xaa-Pro aminopeptidase
LGIGGYEQPIVVENSDLKMEKDMCFCLETPYYQLGWGGMMVEDTILVTAEGYEPITTIPRKLYVL